MRPLLYATDTAGELRIACERLARVSSTTRSQVRLSALGPICTLIVVFFVVVYNGAGWLDTQAAANWKDADHQDKEGWFEWYQRFDFSHIVIHFPDGDVHLHTYLGLLASTDQLPPKAEHIGDFFAIPSTGHIWLWVQQPTMNAPAWIDP